MPRYIGRRFLRLSATLWAAISIGFLAWPVILGEYVNLFLPTTTSRIHLRASHGGLAAGLAIFFWLAAGRPAWHRPALTAAICVYWGLALAAGLGIALEGKTIPRIAAMLLVESLLGLAGFWAISAEPANAAGLADTGCPG